MRTIASEREAGVIPIQRSDGHTHKPLLPERRNETREQLDEVAPLPMVTLLAWICHRRYYPNSWFIEDEEQASSIERQAH